MNDYTDDNSIYGYRAKYYDAIYAWKDYATEASNLHRLIGELGVPDGARLLDAACGTGKHLELLRQWYAGDGFDLNAAMLDFARARVPGARIWQASMADFDVEAPYDAITCLFSAIGHLLDEATLRAAARCFHDALRPGGVLIIEPWLTPEKWDAGRPFAVSHNAGNFSVARVNFADRRDDFAIMDMHWTVAERGRPIERFVEHLELWLCTEQTMHAALTSAGLEAKFEANGLMKDRGLWICRRPL